MKAERAVSQPVVYRLKGDQRQPLVDAQLGNLLVLHAMRPAPQDLPLAHLRKVARLRLREQDDVAFRQQLIPGTKPSETGRQLPVGHAEALAVSAFEIDVLP